jgi:hypothetical protein
MTIIHEKDYPRKDCKAMPGRGFPIAADARGEASERQIAASPELSLVGLWDVVPPPRKRQK